ncbi:MAG: DUF167 domain-containing protein [Pseudomonadota bacterium]
MARRADPAHAVDDSLAASWYRFDPAQHRLTLTLHIQPNARTTAVAGTHGDALKIRIAAPAVDDKANAALIDFLRRWFKLSAANIKIRHGARGRRKVVEIDHPAAGCVALLGGMGPAGPVSSPSGAKRRQTKAG